MRKVITPMATEPLSLSEVKMHLRLTDDTTEDTMLTGFITRARQWAEKYLGRSLGTQTLEFYMNAFPMSRCFALPYPPLQSVTSVKYVDSTGTETTLTVTDDYLVDVDNNRIVLPYGAAWPVFTPYPINPVRIRYVAGYTSIPDPIKHAMLMLIGHWYEHREAFAETVGGKWEYVKYGVDALLSQYRAGWF